jgi:anti-sigma28 factor (negative regulator of flagellin synthesis)
MDVTSVTATGAVARPVQVSATPGATSGATSAAAAYSRAEKPGIVRGTDTIEVSAQARAAAKASRARRSEDAPVRLDLVTRVRDEIQQGTYITLPKMDQAIREMTPELVGV